MPGEHDLLAHRVIRGRYRQSAHTPTEADRKSPVERHGRRLVKAFSKSSAAEIAGVAGVGTTDVYASAPALHLDERDDGAGLKAAIPDITLLQGRPGHTRLIALEGAAALPEMRAEGQGIGRGGISAAGLNSEIQKHTATLTGGCISGLVHSCRST
jgi:hypothetical protein